MAQALKKSKTKTRSSNKRVKNLDLHYHLPRQPVRIALDEANINWSWYEYEVDILKAMWECGYDIRHMATYFKRKPLDIFLMLADLDYHCEISERKNGIFGGD